MYSSLYSRDILASREAPRGGWDVCKPLSHYPSNSWPSETSIALRSQTQKPCGRGPLIQVAQDDETRDRKWISGCQGLGRGAGG